MNAFDARKAWLCEPATNAPGKWRTVSLVTAVRALVEVDGRQAHAGRAEVLRTCLDTLTARGIDGDSLLRYGLLTELMSPILMRHVLRPALNAEQQAELDEHLERAGVDGGAWAAILGGDQDSGEPEPCSCCAGTAPVRPCVLKDTVHRMLPLFAWVLHAPLDALLTLRVPTEAELRAAEEAPMPDPDLMRQYRWIVDRFSTSRLADWHEDSLHLEHRYQAGDVPAPTAEPLMTDRLVTLDELNAEIARRAVKPTPVVDSHYGSALAKQMQGKAEDFLTEGRRPEASALFEFALTQQPDDPDALNNLGFCLLPDDPEAALVYIRRARAQGYTPLGINVFNEATALLALGHARQALQAVEDQWGPISTAPRYAATLWKHDDDGNYSLVQVTDVKSALLDLGVELARSHGGAAAERWHARAAG